MAETFFYYFKTARVVQWIKNVSIFAAITFSGLLFNPVFFKPVFLAFWLFCFLASGVYFLNDLIDADRDRRHPFKKYRPIAAGKISPPTAAVIGAGLIIGSLMAAFYLSVPLFVLMLAYVVLQIVYSLWLKHEPILDIVSIATGFILRVYAGAVVVNLHLSVWFLICVIAFSLFVAAAKRRSEYVLKKGEIDIKQRPVFKFYNLPLLDIYISMFANTTWLSYTLFAYFHPLPRYSENGPVLSLMLPKTFYTQKWLMITVPLVIYGVLRYLLLVYHNQAGESPARTLIKDKPLFVTVLLWAVLVVLVLDSIY
ncbi:MAG: decaprenyl-phosphate phosphoribosyltransferase [bacterium]|nr:decaprenyl-phosphate phosphoribosyltransferase [bacterium]